MQEKGKDREEIRKISYLTRTLSVGSEMLYLPAKITIQPGHFNGVATKKPINLPEGP